MRKHTPGPWIDLQKSGSVWISPQAHRPDSDRATNEVNGGCCIARCYGSDTIANARLIAAAPDLLEALESCALRLTHLAQNSVDVVYELKQARAAIAKATGEQP